MPLPGELQPFESVSIVARVAGYIDTIGVDRGDQVLRGQVLAILVAPELAAQVAEARARVETAVANRIAAESERDSARVTHERLLAASATAGAVAGLEVKRAEDAVHRRGRPRRGGVAGGGRGPRIARGRTSPTRSRDTCTCVPPLPGGSQSAWSTPVRWLVPQQGHWSGSSRPRGCAWCCRYRSSTAQVPPGAGSSPLSSLFTPRGGSPALLPAAPARFQSSDADDGDRARRG